MLELKDFFHLPQVDDLIEQLVADRPGLVLVAGMDSRPANRVPTGILPGGPFTFFGVLARRFVAASARGQTILISQNKNAIRVPDSLRAQVRSVQIRPPLTYAQAIAQAARGRPELIVVDQLQPEMADAVLQPAREGIRVLTRIDCIFSGSGVARHLLELGVSRELFDILRWIITVQRVATLCPECKEPAPLDAGRVAELARQYLNLPVERLFSHSSGCAKCNQTGRRGDVIAFDMFRTADPLDAPAPRGNADLLAQPSLLSMDEYMWHLAALGHVSVDDVAQINSEQLHRTFLLFTASERALTEANVELTRKLVELETAHRVLEHRTDSLIALQEIAHALIASTELKDLAQQICRSTSKLCGADRSILYVLQPDGKAEVVAVTGWEKKVLGARLGAVEVLGDAGTDGHDHGEPTPFKGYPPGIPVRHHDVEGVSLRAGLGVPLVAQDQVVGLMIVHSTRQARFAPGEIANLQTLANQAALAIQRAGLVQSLRENIAQLTAAQAELVKKERLDRELELARGVQQSLVPRVFPELPGYAFAAHSEAARRVGGDFYDVFRIDADHFGLVIADVSDKGMPAALFMALTRSLLFAEARRELSPRKVLTSVHRLLLELGEPDMFVTAFYGVVDTSTRTLTYSRAGHERPLLLRQGTMERLHGKGTILGVLDWAEFLLSEEHVQLEQGDRLVLYTDGLVDAMDSHEQAFGLDRLVALAVENAQTAPDALCRKIFSKLADYGGMAEQFDDMALVIMDVK